MADRNVYVCIVVGQDAIVRLRKLIGATDPAKAEKGTLRQLYGESVRQNGFHASDNEQ